MKNRNSLRLYPTKGNLHRQLTDTTSSHVSNLTTDLLVHQVPDSLFVLYHEK